MTTSNGRTGNLKNEPNPLGALFAMLALDFETLIETERGAWSYAIACDLGASDLEGLARRYGWTPETVERLTVLHTQFNCLRAIFECALRASLDNPDDGRVVPNVEDIRCALDCLIDNSVLEPAREVMKLF